MQTFGNAKILETQKTTVIYCPYCNYHFDMYLLVTCFYGIFEKFNGMNFPEARDSKKTFE